VGVSVRIVPDITVGGGWGEEAQPYLFPLLYLLGQVVSTPFCASQWLQNRYYESNISLEYSTI
jgi:hypothetical protein